MPLIARQFVGRCPMAVIVCLSLLGCERGDPPPAAAVDSPAATADPARSGTPAEQAAAEPPVAHQPARLSPPPWANAPAQAPPPTAPPANRDDADALFADDGPPVRLPPKPMFDEGKIRAAGIRKLVGKHLVLYTDLPPAPIVDELPQVFDQAVPLWCKFFSVDEAKVADWQMIGSLIGEKNRFMGAGLFPADLPPFPTGYHRDWQFWLYEQPGDYYSRHLVLHEGTHAFMRAFLGSAGPPWFQEGVAEYLGTHRWQNNELTLGYMPRDNDEVPFLGRVKIIKDDYSASQAHTLQGVLQFNAQAHLRTEAYAWSWAAVMLLSEHPASQSAFQDMYAQVNLAPAPFAAKLKNALGERWPELEEQWQLLVVNMEYGYDVRRNAVQYAPGRPLPAAGAEVEVAADRGWQSSGYHLEQGKRYRITAAGRYTIASQGKPWACEPGGVTLRYYRGLPLGTLMGALRPADPPAGSVSALVAPRAIGLSEEVEAEYSGVLYLSINEHPAEWFDNSGGCLVRIEPAVNEALP